MCHGLPHDVVTIAGPLFPTRLLGVVPDGVTRAVPNGCGPTIGARTPRGGERRSVATSRVEKSPSATGGGATSVVERWTRVCRRQPSGVRPSTIWSRSLLADGTKDPTSLLPIEFATPSVKTGVLPSFGWSVDRAAQGTAGRAWLRRRAPTPAEGPRAAGQSGPGGLCPVRQADRTRRPMGSRPQ